MSRIFDLEENVYMVMEINEEEDYLIAENDYAEIKVSLSEAGIGKEEIKLFHELEDGLLIRAVPDYEGD